MLRSRKGGLAAALLLLVLTVTVTMEEPLGSDAATVREFVRQRTDFDAFFGFDDRGRLVEVHVRKMVDAL